MAIRTRKGETGPRRRVFFIAEATRNRGDLTNYVMETYGQAGFERSSKTGRWIIRPEVVRGLVGKCPVCQRGVCVCPTAKTRRRAQLALRLAEINRRRYGR